MICLNRLVYRKGIDLQVEIIPHLCRKYRELHFILGGDGPKRQALEDMITENDLQERVQLAGFMQHEKARDLLVQGE